MEKYELKTHKEFHGIQLQNFSVKHRSMILALCYKLMDQESNLLEFDVKEIARISNYKPLKAGDNIYVHLENIYDELKSLTIKVDKTNGIKKFVLFTTFETFEDTGMVHIAINKDYRYMLNKVTEPFTLQNLVEYSNLKSGYSQLTYSLLKEWEGNKFIKLTIDEFRDKLGVPEKYGTSDFNKRVLAPVMEELSKFFPNLKLEKIKTGRKVTDLKFTWSERKKEITMIDSIPETKEIIISQKMDKIIKEIKNKNYFMKKFLTKNENENLYYLLENYKEKELLIALPILIKNINDEINLSYVKKGIEIALTENKEKRKKKIIVADDNEKVSENTLLEKKSKELIEITAEEYNNIYKKYLLDINATNTKTIKEIFDKENKNKYKIIEPAKKIEVNQEEYEKMFLEYAKDQDIKKNRKILEKFFKVIFNSKYTIRK